MVTKKLILTALAAFLLTGCSVISSGVREEVNREVTVPVVQSDPGAYRGAKVLWGGVIISAENLEKTTEIEVMDTPLNWDDTPDVGATSRGRFIIEASGFLDTQIYKPDKMITVAGVVEGVRTRKVGEMDYPYPVLKPLEIKITVPQPERYYDWPPWYYYPPYDPLYPYPYYPYGPYRHPWRRWP